MRIVPVILCGGSGTRLWPLSRRSFPKQFARLAGDETLLQATARRLSGPGLEPPVVVTQDELRFIVLEQLAALGIRPAAVLIEPEGRNTAPAVLAAALHVEAEIPGAALLVAPADHAIPDEDAFRQAVKAGIPAVEAGRIVTFGITPDRPETGYGYLRLAGPPVRRGPRRRWRVLSRSRTRKPPPRCWRPEITCGTPASSWGGQPIWCRPTVVTRPICWHRSGPRLRGHEPILAS